MARDRSPIVKQSRREGVALHPKAHKVMVKRTAPPGKHPQDRRGRTSGYGNQLREKQKVKRMYGLLEKQFRRLVTEAGRTKGRTGAVLLSLLERRIDNVVYRAQFAVSRRAARQLVNHGHFTLNGQRVDIPSIRVSAGDVIEVREKSKSSEYFKNMEELTAHNEQGPSSWVAADAKKFIIKVTGEPKREEAEPGINEQLIVEYYSR